MTCIPLPFSWPCSFLDAPITLTVYRLRKQLTTQVARLEAQLKRARQSVQQERAEVDSVLYRLSSALAGVDAELLQSAVSTDESNELLATTRKHGQS